MNDITRLAGQQSAMGRISQQILDQQRAIDDVSRTNIPMPSFPKIPVVKNPLIETNKRLAQIETRFERMQEIANNAATIANGLQGAAAEFLVKFERAATDNDRAARKAIWLGCIAMAIAVFMPLVQIAYSEYRREPTNTGDTQQAILNGLKAELTASREAQALANRHLMEVLSATAAKRTEILQEMKELQATNRPAAP
jgi:hypothetical protein